MVGLEYPIKLKHKNLLPGSEIITVPGGQFDALVRDQDYTIDYKNGIVTIALTGIVATLPQVHTSDVVDLNISYRRKVNFSEEFILESHVEVFNEVAIVSDVFQLTVTNGPVLDVFRAFNRTTGELYTVSSFLNKTIFITGSNTPRAVDLARQTSLLRTRVISNGQFDNTLGIILPEDLQPAKEHKLTSANIIQADTLFKFLVRGGVDIVENIYEIEVTPQASGVELYTGSTILRRATRRLISNVDFVATINATTMLLTVTLTATGKAVIGSNSVFYRLNKTYPIQGQSLFEGANITESEHRLAFVEDFLSEVVSFGADSLAHLLGFEPFIKKGQEVDEFVFPSLVVTNQAGTITFVEGTDYVVDTAFKRLIRVSTSTTLLPHATIKVIYVDQEDFFASITIMQDVVLVDYDYGSNALNWTPSFTDTVFEERRELAEDTRFVTLSQFPADKEVIVFRTLDNQRVQQINVVDVDLVSKRIQLDPVPATTTYIIEYTARDQVIDPGTNYFISYRYGARKRALMDNFATLLGITTGTVIRTETFDLVNGQGKVVLGTVPSDHTRILIYATGDPDKTPLATAKTFDTSTDTLFFTNVISAGNYTIEYPVVGFQTEQLRTAIIALLQSFILGPTRESLVLLVQALTGIEPDVIESLSNGFNLTSGTDSDFLNPLPPVISPPLSDGSSSIEFAPSRFNNGVSLKAANNAWISYSALNNLRVEEGSFSFLLGTLWDGDDERPHHLFDMVGTDNFTNRITLYKNKRGSLAFEIHDKHSKLHRVTTDINRIVRNEIIFLEEGQSSVRLAHSPAYTIVDLNNNQQSDIFEANRTEFIITPIFGGIAGLGLNITTLVQISDDPSFVTQIGQAAVAAKLRALANVYESHQGKLTVQTEKSFIEGCQLFDNVLLELAERGHDVHLFIDLPQSVISDQERELYILERRNLLNAIGIEAGDKDGIAGGFEIDNFASVFPELGLDYASAFIDPLTNEGLVDRTDVFRASLGPEFSIPDPEGALVYMPGDVNIDFQKNPMIVQSFIPITNSLLSAAAMARPDVINSWYFVVNVNDFTVPETVLFNGWITSVVDPLVQTGRVFWRTLSGTLTVFREYEKFLEINRNRVRFVTGSYGSYGVYGYGGLQEIKALTWDEVHNLLSFTPIEKSGFYLFSYISGFSKFEEAEHFITCTWKLHTRDQMPPVVKMFLDGELVNHKIFGDL